MYLRDRNLIYIHINKTGGTSIRDYFGFTGFSPHWTTSRFQEELGDDFEGCFKFAFVRNPWDRFVSIYHYRIATGGYDFTLNSDISNLSFTEWIFTINDFISKVPRIGFGPQWNWLLDKDGQMVMDFVGRFENFTVDFEKLCKITDHPVAPIKKLNSSKHDPYWCYYDSKTVDVVSDWSKKDIEEFGYEFGQSI